MQLGYLGLGKMGKNMVLRLLEKGHEVVAWNRSPEPREEVAAAGATAVAIVEEVVSSLQAPRTIWLMLPAGDVTGEVIAQLSEILEPGDTIIDGANSFFKDSVSRSELLEEKGIHFLDAGISGGPSGAREGACVMVGGTQEQFDRHQRLLADVAAPGALQFFEGSGAGHFVKMVHNGIEYGMMQAIAEGFDVMKQSDYDLDLVRVADVYNNRSVIESRLIDWMKKAYKEHGRDLNGIFGSASHSGEGLWTVETAKEMSIVTPVISDSLQARIESQKIPTYQGQVVSALRNQFGGHEVEDKQAKST